MVTPICAGTFLLIFNNGNWESGNLSPTSTTSWAQEPFPSPGPNGVIALASTGVTNGPNGLVLDNSAVLWRRVDQSTFTQIATGDLSPNSFDFYSSPFSVFAGFVVVGNIGVPPGATQQSYVAGGGPGPNPIFVFAFPNPPFAPGLTFMRFWADERKLTSGAPFTPVLGFFMAQLRDAQNVDHLYTSGDTVHWTSLTLPSTPV